MSHSVSAVQDAAESNISSDQKPREHMPVCANAAPASAPPMESSRAGQLAAKQELAKTETDIEKRMSAFERATLRWTRAMFIVTTATALFIGFQWKEMHDAGEQTERIIKADERLAAAMNDSVSQAKKGLDASTEISHSDQRAWLGITAMQITSLQPAKIEVNIPLQNSGKTAAVDVRTRSFVHLTDTPVNVPAFTASSREPFRARMTIFPNITNANITITSPQPFSEADIAAIKNGRKLMYAFGEIKYKDVFDRQHHTFFCGMYSQLTPNNLVYCNDYNGAD